MTPSSQNLPDITLHIGATKTGSSALQSLLYRNRESLAAAGVLYPDVGIASSAHHLLMAAIHPGAWKMHQADYDVPPEDYFRRGWYDVLKESKRQHCSRIVLSSEYLWGIFGHATYDRLRHATKGCNIRILACVRDPAQWTEATYLQAVKSGETRDFAAWYGKMRKLPLRGFDFLRVIQGWEQELGARQVTVLPYEFDDPLDFMAGMFRAATGIELSAMPHHEMPAASNPSPTAEGLRLLRELNRIGLPEAERRDRARIIMQSHGRAPNSRELHFLGGPEGSEALATANRMMGQLMQRYLGADGQAEDSGNDAPAVPLAPTTPLYPDDLSPLQFAVPPPGGHEEMILQHFGHAACRVSDPDPVLGHGCMMLATPGCGSRLLSEMLKGTGRLMSFTEGVNGNTVIKRARQHGLTTMKDYLIWLKDHKTGPQAKRRGAAFALKISVEQAMMLHRFGIVPHLFTSVDWLFLRQRDIVSQAVSLAITQQERSIAAQGIRADAGLNYDFDQISRLVRAITLGNALIQQVLNIFECRYHVVEYEDIIQHPGRVAAGVLDGFGLKPARPRTASRQVTVIDGDIHAGFRARYLDDLRKSLLAT